MLFFFFRSPFEISNGAIDFLSAVTGVETAGPLFTEANSRTKANAKDLTSEEVSYINHASNSYATFSHFLTSSSISPAALISIRCVIRSFFAAPPVSITRFGNFPL